MQRFRALWVTLTATLAACATPTPVPVAQPVPTTEVAEVVPVESALPAVPEALPPIDASLLGDPTPDWSPWDAWAARNAAATTDLVPPAKFMHVVQAGGAIAIAGSVPWPVAPDAPSEAHWAALLLRYGATTVHRASPHSILLVTSVRPGAVPGAMQKLSGKRLEAFSVDGEACEGSAGETVEVLYLDHELYQPPPGESFDPWDELDSLLTISEYLRNSRRKNRYIGLRIRSAEPCTDAIWARQATGKPVSVADVGEPSAAELERAKTELLLSDDSRFAAALWDRESWGHWLDVDEYNLRRGAVRHLDGAGDRIVVNVVEPGPGVRWITATARGGHHQCSSPATELFRAWVVTGDQWTPLAAPRPGSGAVPSIVLDVDDDGQWEFLENGPGGATLHTLRNGQLIERTVPVIPHFAVSC